MTIKLINYREIPLTDEMVHPDASHGGSAYSGVFFVVQDRMATDEPHMVVATGKTGVGDDTVWTGLRTMWASQIISEASWQ